MSLEQEKRERLARFEKQKIVPVTRTRFLEEWRSDPNAVIQRANETDLTLDGYASVRSPASPESNGNAIDYLLFNEGIRMIDTINAPSSLLDDLPPLYREDNAKGLSNDPLARLMAAYLDSRYLDSFIKGTRAADLSNLVVDSYWRPTAQERPIRSPQRRPGFNFLEVCAFTRGIRGDKYKVNRLTNLTSETNMAAQAEATLGELAELGRSEHETTLVEYRKGIEWTDNFANDPTARAADLTNAVEEIGIQHRIANLGLMGKTVKDNVPSNNTYAAGTVAGNAHVAGKIEYPQYIHFVKLFGDAYMPNVALGTRDAITNLELMPMGTGDVTFGNWQLIPNSNINSLNDQQSMLNYGWISNSATGFIDTELFMLQRETSLIFVTQLGMDQNEIERDAGQRKTRRWLGTSSAFAVYDPEGMRRMTY